MAIPATEPVPLDRRLIAPRPRGAELARADAVGDGLWCLRLPLPYPSTRSVNCYLLATGDGWTLVDCGSAVGAGWAALERALALARVEPRAITTLLLTHLHADHASLAGEVVRRLGCELVRLDAPATSSERLAEPAIPLAERRRAALAEGVPLRDLDIIVDAPLAGDVTDVALPVDRVLAAGDEVVGGWTVVPAPGHAPSQLALHDARRRVLISADAAFADIPPYLEWGHTSDPVAEYRTTLTRLESLGAELVLPGHGRPDRRPPQRFGAARAALDAVVARVEGAVHAAPSSAYEVTCRIIGHEPDPDLRQSWLSRTLCVLEHLAGRGAVKVEFADAGRRWARG
jgi:glyoxylase-like metal-dependent hydrolase (beta-lactamase superfamily II)